MEINPFDRFLDAHKNQIPSEIHDAAIHVNDSLEICWLSAKNVFGDKATPEIALAMYDRLEEKAKNPRRNTVRRK